MIVQETVFVAGEYTDPLTLWIALATPALIGLLILAFGLREDVPIRATDPIEQQ